jgi:hypothetical protein
LNQETIYSLNVRIWRELCVQNLKGKSLRTTICKLVLGAVVNNIWSQRSCRILGGQIKSEEAVVKTITREVRKSGTA